MTMAAAISLATEEKAFHGDMKPSHQRLCVGCGGQIHDQFILQVAPNLEWHAACLRCCECQMFLDETHTCFVRDGRIFCRGDYLRLFSARCCHKCLRPFGPRDYVMRARGRIFHQDCFRCSACEKQLVPGEEFSLRQDDIFCKEDHLKAVPPASNSTEENNNNNNGGSSNSVNNDDEDDDSLARAASVASAGANSDDDDSFVRRPGSAGEFLTGGGGGGGGEKQSRPPGSRQQSNVRRNRAGRVRTVLSEKQLSLLKSCYNANPRPDALMKEQLTEMTGLSSRVIRVWFQNKRCKDKKKTLRQGKDCPKLGYSSMSGVPMIASPPSAALMRGPPHPHPHFHPFDHPPPPGFDPSGGAAVPPDGYDVRCYEPPWKALCQFALNADIDKIGSPGADEQHQFHRIAGQMHGFSENDPMCDPGGVGVGVGVATVKAEDCDGADYTVTSLDNPAQVKAGASPDNAHM